MSSMVFLKCKKTHQKNPGSKSFDGMFLSCILLCMCMEKNASLHQALVNLLCKLMVFNSELLLLRLLKMSGLRKDISHLLLNKLKLALMM